MILRARLLLFAFLLCLTGVAAASSPGPDLRIEGVDGTLLDNVRAHLTLAAEPCEAPDWRLAALRGRAEEEAGKALRAFGHYRPDITVGEFSHTEGCWSLALHIDPGPPVLVGDVTVIIAGEAADDPVFQRMKEKLPLVSGSPLRHADYEAAKDAIASLALERGYLHGEFRAKKLLVHPEELRADIVLDFDAGKRYRFGPVHLRQDILDPAFLDRFVKVRPGDPYHAETVANLHRALADSRYFQSVEVRPQHEEAEDLLIPVEVRLFPRKPHTYSFGLGASTDTGPRASAGYENRLVNRRGHRLAANLSLSQVLSELTAEYTIPLFRNPLDESLAFSAGFKRERTDTDDSDILQLGAMLNQRRGAWQESAFLDLSRESSHLGEETVDATLLVPGMLWTRTEADAPIRPLHGYRLRVKAQGTHQMIFSDASFLQVNTAAKGISSFSWKGRLLARGEFATSLVEAFGELPGSFRFFAGGDASVRGYAYKSLGPRDATGRVKGGRHLLVGSVEYEQPLTEAWSLAAFFDSGNALDSLADSYGELRSGMGLGIRWHSPIGPLRLDLAHPLDDPENWYRLHFSMGPDL